MSKLVMCAAASLLLLGLGACQQTDYAAGKEDGKKIIDNLAVMGAEAAKPAPAFADLKTAQLTYFESRAFDSDLGDSMKAGIQEIAVTVPTPFPLSAVPERLDRWLYAVKENGGRMVAEALPPKDTQVATRGLFPLVLELVLPLIVQALETDIHDYAEGYDGTVYYTPEDGRAQKIVFRKRVK